MVSHKFESVSDTVTPTIGSPLARQHPDWFEFRRRDVTPADVERLTREDVEAAE
jgi:hypothetical protein